MRRAFWVVGILLLGLVLWLAPEEKTLGGAVRLVYFHGALIWTSLILYALSAIAATACLLTARPKAFAAATSLWRWAVAANAISLPTGLYAAKVIWGAVLWSEPRVMTNAVMLLASVLVLGVSLISSNRRGLSALYAVAVVSYGVMLVRTSRVLHPVNPIGSSDSVTIKVCFALITLIALALAIEAVRRETNKA